MLLAVTQRERPDQHAQPRAAEAAVGNDGVVVESELLAPVVDKVKRRGLRQVGLRLDGEPHFALIAPHNGIVEVHEVAITSQLGEAFLARALDQQRLHLHLPRRVRVAGELVRHKGVGAQVGADGGEDDVNVLERETAAGGRGEKGEARRERGEGRRERGRRWRTKDLEENKVGGFTVAGMGGRGKV